MRQVATRARTLSPLVSLVMVASAAGSLIAMFIVGHRQRSIVLMLMFAAWVLSPFGALALLHARSRSWRESSRSLLRGGTLLISIGALATYVHAVMRPLKSQPASTFLIVPFVSWVALAAGVAIAAMVARRDQGTTEGDLPAGR